MSEIDKTLSPQRLDEAWKIITQGGAPDELQAAGIDYNTIESELQQAGYPVQEALDEALGQIIGEHIVRRLHE